MRFIKKILQLFNLLGIIIPPDRIKPANEIVITCNDVTIPFYMEFTGFIRIVSKTGNYIRSADQYSLVNFSLDNVPGSENVVTGNITYVRISSGYDCMTISDNVRAIQYNNANLSIFDLRNAAKLYVRIGVAPTSVKRLYARADTSDIATICQELITNSIYDGDLYIRPNEEYAQTVIDTAVANNWNVYLIH